MAGLKAKVTKENPNEQYFRWYCEELIQYGYLKRIDREPELLAVFPKLVHKKEKHYKSKKENTIEEHVMFQPTNYTYDYRLVWTEKAINIFIELYNPDTHFIFGGPIFVAHNIVLDTGIEIVSYVDVKPHFAAVMYGGGKMASFYTFPLIQKYLFMTNKVYINKIIPINTGKHGVNTCLFASTFVPNRYRYTDKSGDLRKIPFKQRSIVSFTTQKKEIITNLMKSRNEKNNQTSLL